VVSTVFQSRSGAGARAIGGACASSPPVLVWREAVGPCCAQSLGFSTFFCTLTALSPSGMRGGA